MVRGDSAEGLLDAYAPGAYGGGASTSVQRRPAGEAPAVRSYAPQRDDAGDLAELVPTYQPT